MKTKCRLKCMKMHALVCAFICDLWREWRRKGGCARSVQEVMNDSPIYAELLMTPILTPWSSSGSLQWFPDFLDQISPKWVKLRLKLLNLKKLCVITPTHEYARRWIHFYFSDLHSLNTKSTPIDGSTSLFTLQYIYGICRIWSNDQIRLLMQAKYWTWAFVDESSLQQLNMGSQIGRSPL
jgi:hypothetical protein